MRITFHEVNANLQYNIMRNYNKLATLQEQIATGRRLNKPSDDPVDVTNDLGLRSNIQALGQYKRNINDGIAFMGVTDTALTSMNELMQRVKELGIQASNDTYSAAERSFVADELSQLTRQMITLINTTYKGDFIFGGANTRTPPYTVEAGTFTNAVDNTTYPLGVAIPVEDNSVAPPILNTTNLMPKTVVVEVGGTTLKEGVDYEMDYNNGTITPLAGGAFAALPAPPASTTLSIRFEWIKKADVPNTDIVRREIEQDVATQINTFADQVFDDPVNQTNLVDALTAFGQSLVQNNPADLRDSLTNIEFVFKNILSAEATNGSRMNRFELTRTRTETQIIEVTRLQSELEDADMAEVVTEFSLLQNVYNASLKAGASIIQPSLVDFLS